MTHRVVSLGGVGSMQYLCVEPFQNAGYLAGVSGLRGSCSHAACMHGAARLLCMAAWRQVMRAHAALPAPTTSSPPLPPTPPPPHTHTPTGFNAAVTSCQKVFAYYWMHVALEFGILCAMTLMLAAGTLPKARLSFVGLLAVASALYISGSDAFLGAVQVSHYGAGYEYYTAMATAAGWVLVSFVSAFVACRLARFAWLRGWRWAFTALGVPVKTVIVTKTNTERLSNTQHQKTTTVQPRPHRRAGPQLRARRRVLRRRQAACGGRAAGIECLDGVMMSDSCMTVCLLISLCGRGVCAWSSNSFFSCKHHRRRRRYRMRMGREVASLRGTHAAHREPGGAQEAAQLVGRWAIDQSLQQARSPRINPAEAAPPQSPASSAPRTQRIEATPTLKSEAPLASIQMLHESSSL